MRNITTIRAAFVVSAGFLVHAMTFAGPPQILQIYREPLKPASNAAYDAIEVETARVAAQLGCPNPYLAAESLSGSKEVWWFNGYDSAGKQQEVFDAYAKNTPLMSALQGLSARKKSLTLAPIEVFARHRPELSAGASWTLGEGRYLVVTTTSDTVHVAGTVFEAADGIRFIVRSAQSREQAEALREAGGGDTRVLAVRPSWSFPATAWIAADVEFWEPRPVP
jgi:hypothetical protein